jgi:hypothetical protein
VVAIRAAAMPQVTATSSPAHTDAGHASGTAGGTMRTVTAAGVSTTGASTHGTRPPRVAGTAATMPISAATAMCRYVGPPGGMTSTLATATVIPAVVQRGW